ncbi:hypothetical protein PTTG_27796 [Puccinia triticina 1-1 BBBD Race 1]|uniref:Uncharacterized protein n=1 Tax=Puccinia triticina (isolate 1-1 / race 1 (BBBD)) TaxID=630390 RepID=A0A180GHF5_PUCT1|nr:hypothetical protein PTTG_27796 [Puccinia triticina 1-1 BBBD Race 1]
MPPYGLAGQSASSMQAFILHWMYQAMVQEERHLTRVPNGRFEGKRGIAREAKRPRALAPSMKLHGSCVAPAKRPKFGRQFDGPPPFIADRSQAGLPSTVKRTDDFASTPGDAQMDNPLAKERAG